MWALRVLAAPSCLHRLLLHHMKQCNIMTSTAVLACQRLLQQEQGSAVLLSSLHAGFLLLLQQSGSSTIPDS
jgi:hypothetical protein